MLKPTSPVLKPTKNSHPKENVWYAEETWASPLLRLKWVEADFHSVIFVARMTVSDRLSAIAQLPFNSVSSAEASSSFTNSNNNMIKDGCYQQTVKAVATPTKGKDENEKNNRNQGEWVNVHVVWTNLLLLGLLQCWRSIAKVG